MVKEEKVKLKLQSFTLELFIRYVLTTNNGLVKRRGLLNLRKFMNILDFKSYISDFEIIDRLRYIRLALKARLNESIENTKLIRLYVKEQGGQRIDPIIYKEARNAKILNSEEIGFVDHYVVSNLRTIHIHQNKDLLVDALDEFEIGDYEDKNSQVERIFSIVREMLDYERKIKIKEEYEREVDFGSPDLKNQLIEIINESHDSRNYLYSGSQWLNEMVGGQFEAGRCYLFLGPPKSFKSGLLLTMALWFRKFNTHVEPRDPNKKPCILYITQENSVQETIERMFTMESNDGQKMKNSKTKYVLDTLMSGKHFSAENSNICLKLIYKPAGSICTDDLYAIIDDIEDEGKEVICLIHDHAKKMKPSNSFKSDKRHLELGSIIEDFTTIAKTKNLIFIATAHMNRNSMSAIDTRKAAGKSGNVGQLRSSDVGESLAMVENADVSIGVLREENLVLGQFVLGFKLFFSRVANASNRELFYLPFAKNKKQESTNTIRLRSDFGREKVVSFEGSDDSYGNMLQDKGYTRIMSVNRPTELGNKFEKERKQFESSRKDISTNDIMNDDDDIPDYSFIKKKKHSED